MRLSSRAGTCQSSCVKLWRTCLRPSITEPHTWSRVLAPSRSLTAASRYSRSFTLWAIDFPVFAVCVTRPVLGSTISPAFYLAFCLSSVLGVMLTAEAWAAMAAMTTTEVKRVLSILLFVYLFSLMIIIWLLGFLFKWFEKVRLKFDQKELPNLPNLRLLAAPHQL